MVLLRLERNTGGSEIPVCCFIQVEVRLQQHHGSAHQAGQPHVVLVQNQTPQGEPEGLQGRLQEQAAEPEQAGSRNREAAPGQVTSSRNRATPQTMTYIELKMSSVKCL